MKEQGDIFVDVRVIGYQFNKKSLGTRCLSRGVTLQTEKIGSIFLFGRVLRVRRLGEKSHFWEVIP